VFRLANSSRAERIRRPQRRMVMTQGRINVFRDDVVVQPVPSREARAISIVEESSNRHELVSARGTLRNISCITLFLQTTYRDSQTNHPLTCSNAFSHPSSFSVLTSRPVRRWTSRKLSTFSPSSCPLKCGYSIRSISSPPRRLPGRQHIPSPDRGSASQVNRFQAPTLSHSNLSSTTAGVSAKNRVSTPGT